MLTDGFPVRRLDVPNLSIKKGDAVTASVAAASIVAKVTRDRMMDRYHRRFPAYGFDHNRGYGTAGAPRGDQAARPVADPPLLVQGAADRLLRRREWDEPEPR